MSISGPSILTLFLSSFFSLHSLFYKELFSVYLLCHKLHISSKYIDAVVVKENNVD